MRIPHSPSLLLGGMALGLLITLGQQALSHPDDKSTPQIKKPSTKLTVLMTQRRDLLRQTEQVYLAHYKQGQGSLDEVKRASQAAIQADLELPHSRAERIALLQAVVDQAKQEEEIAHQRVQAGAALQTEEMEARIASLEAQINLERETSSRTSR